jgi:hypothetical protein
MADEVKHNLEVKFLVSNLSGEAKDSIRQALKSALAKELKAESAIAEGRFSTHNSNHSNSPPPEE